MVRRRSSPTPCPGWSRRGLPWHPRVRSNHRLGSDPRLIRRCVLTRVRSLAASRTLMSLLCRSALVVMDKNLGYRVLAKRRRGFFQCFAEICQFRPSEGQIWPLQEHPLGAGHPLGSGPALGAFTQGTRSGHAFPCARPQRLLRNERIPPDPLRRRSAAARTERYRARDAARAHRPSRAPCSAPGCTSPRAVRERPPGDSGAGRQGCR